MEDRNLVEVPALKKWSEDLSWQASRAVELGRMHCNCPGYFHLLWSPLRAAKFARGLTVEDAILAATTAPYVKDHSRILIGGAADPGQLCTLGRIAGTRSPDFFVTDRCKAPLMLIQEYASMHSISCGTIHGDMLDLDPTKKWDLVFLHYTNCHIEHRLRGKVVKRLAESLAPGGTIVSVDLTGERPKDEHLGDLQNAIYAEMRSALQSSEIESLTERNELDSMLQSYATEKVARSIHYPTVQEIDRAMEEARLTILTRKSTGRKRVTRSNDSIELDSVSSSIVVASLDKI